jgi:pyruvate/2-oxoglutarate dehydrogenase complex dihydrolipoamide acyltransferase (E2) component
VTTDKGQEIDTKEENCHFRFFFPCLHTDAGEHAKKDEVVVSIETDKVVVEIRAPQAGLMKEVFVQEGDDVPVGAKLFSLDTAAAAPAGKITSS